MDADRHVHPRPTPRSTPQRLKIESTEGHPCSRHGVTTPPTDRHRADDALTAAITPSRWRPLPPSSSSSRVTASSSFSVPGNIGGGEGDEHQDHEQGNECSHVIPASKFPSHLIPQCLTSRSAE